MEFSPENYSKISLEAFMKKNPTEITNFCNSIYSHSFAVLDISYSLELMEKMKRVNDENMKFFTGSSLETKMQTQVLFNEVGENKGLVGFNNPSPAKELFRIRRPYFTQNLHQNQQQQNSLFLSANEWCLEFLENLAIECTRELIQDYNNNNPEKQIDGNQTIFNHNEKNYELPNGKYYPSPYDLFYYHNDAKVNTPNCSDHVDPGFITLVPCAFVAGLEIFDTKTGKWIEIEKKTGPYERNYSFSWKIFTNNHQ
jgi:hypothetical protein